MSPQPTKHDPTSHQTEKQKSLDREIKELISALTSRIGSLQRPGGSTSNHDQHINNEEDDEQGVRVITLAGNNQGATMRAGDTDNNNNNNNNNKLPVGVDPQGSAQPDQEDFATYVNSNFQAINNSIMLGGSYRTNDPGVHLDISDYKGHELPMHVGNKGRRNKRRSPKSDHRQEAEHTEDTISDDDN